MKKYTKDTVLTFATQFIAIGIGFATNILIARLLGPEGKGIFTIASLFPFVIAMIVALGIDEANVFVLGKDKTQHNKVLSNSLFLWVIMSIFSLAMIYSFKEPILIHLLKGFETNYFIFVIVSIPFFLLLRYTRAIFQGQGDFWKFNGFFILQNGLNLIIASFLITKYKITGVIMSIFLSVLITSVISLIFVYLYKRDSSLTLRMTGENAGDELPRYSLHPQIPLLKKSLSYGLKAEPGVVFNFFNQRLDMFIVNFFVGPIEVGFYSVAVAFAELLTKIPEAFGITLFPKIADSSQEKGNEFTAIILRNIIIMTVIGGILLAILAKPLLFITFGSKFYPALIPMRILIPGVIFMGITRIICSNFQGQGRPEYGTYLTIISVIFTILLDILLIPKYKSTGAAVASTVSYSLGSIISIIIFKRRSKIGIAELLIPKNGILKEMKLIWGKE